MNNWFDIFLYGDQGTSAGWQSVLLVMAIALIVGHLIAWVYMVSHTGLSYSRMFVGSLVVIPVIVSLVMLIMAGNIVIAFGLLAVFAVVRFRNVLKDTRDTTFVLWAIIEGLGVGTMRFGTALIGAVCIALIFLYMRLASFGSRHRYDVILSLQWTAQAAATGVLKPILRRHAIRAQLASQRRAGEQETDLSYRLLLRDPTRSNELLAELRALEGVSHASLYVCEDESEL